MRRMLAARPEAHHIAFLARLALVSVFLASAVTKALDFPKATAEVRSLLGIEPAAFVAALVVGVQLWGSILVLAGGRRAVAGAILLGGFTLSASVLVHGFWSHTGPAQIRELMIFLEHLGLVAGLYLVASASNPERFPGRVARSRKSAAAETLVGRRSGCRGAEET